VEFCLCGLDAIHWVWPAAESRRDLFPSDALKVAVAGMFAQVR
jgi:hypothetical protein